jgi:hypothetical protein
MVPIKRTDRTNQRYYTNEPALSDTTKERIVSGQHR